MSIPVTTDLNYIDALRDKIEQLERLNKLKESENKILQDVLKEIGAEIKEEVHEITDCNYTPPDCFKMVMTREIFLRKAYAWPLETEETLRKIEEALSRYGYTKCSI